MDRYNVQFNCFRTNTSKCLLSEISFFAAAAAVVDRLACDVGYWRRRRWWLKRHIQSQTGARKHIRICVLSYHGIDTVVPVIVLHGVRVMWRHQHHTHSSRRRWLRVCLWCAYNFERDGFFSSPALQHSVVLIIYKYIYIYSLWVVHDDMVRIDGGMSHEI